MCGGWHSRPDRLDLTFFPNEDSTILDHLFLLCEFLTYSEKTFPFSEWRLESMSCLVRIFALVFLEILKLFTKNGLEVTNTKQRALKTGIPPPAGGEALRCCPCQNIPAAEGRRGISKSRPSAGSEDSRSVPFSPTQYISCLLESV